MPGFHIITGGRPCNDTRGYSSTSGMAYIGPSNTIETARSHRYLLELSNFFGLSEIALYGYKCSRPSPEIDEIVIHNGQDEIYRPGKNRWKPIEFTFYEVVKLGGDDWDMRGTGASDLTAELIYRWWSNAMLDIRESRHRPTSEYLVEGRLAMKDGLDNTIWEYHLLDCWPLKVTPSNLDYTDTTIANITLTLRFSKAIEKGLVETSERGRPAGAEGSADRAYEIAKRDPTPLVRDPNLSLRES